MNEEEIIKVLWMVVGILIVVFILSTIFVGDVLILNLLAFSIIACVGYITLIGYLEYRRIKNYEEFFPLLLSDLIESKRAGLSLPMALMYCKGNYGMLTDEVRKMQIQLSWNIPFEEVLEKFMQRVKKSNILTKSLAIILESYKNGENIENVLVSIRDTILKALELREFKKSVIHTHVTIMYVVFAGFILLSLLLIKFIVPLFKEFGGLGAGGIFGEGLSMGASPCASCEDNACIFFCSIYNTFSKMANFEGAETLEGFYKSFFTLSIIMVGLSCGIMIGQISTGEWSESAKNALILAIIGLIIMVASNIIGLI